MSLDILPFHLAHRVTHCNTTVLRAKFIRCKIINQGIHAYVNDAILAEMWLQYDSLIRIDLL